MGIAGILPPVPFDQLPLAKERDNPQQVEPEHVLIQGLRQGQKEIGLDRAVGQGGVGFGAAYEVPQDKIMGTGNVSHRPLPTQGTTSHRLPPQSHSPHGPDATSQTADGQ